MFRQNNRKARLPFSVFRDEQTDIEVIDELNSYIKYYRDSLQSKLKKLTDLEKSEIAEANEALDREFYLRHKLPIQVLNVTRYKFSVYDLENHNNKVSVLSAQIQQLDRLEKFKNRITSTIVITPIENIKEDLQPILARCYLDEGKKTSNLTKTLLSALGPQNKEFVRNQFIAELESYKTTRRMEAVDDIRRDKKLENSFKTFFGWVANFSAKVKMDAAEKIIKLLKKEPTELKTLDIQALRDSRLGRIISKYEDLGMLPEAFLNKERGMIERVEARATYRA